MKLGLRAGNEKTGDSADTVGCCSLRAEHLRLRRRGRNYFVSLNFLGKDSIRFKKDVKVPSMVYKRLSEILRGKGRKGYVFDLLTVPTILVSLRSIPNYFSPFAIAKAIKFVIDLNSEQAPSKPHERSDSSSLPYTLGILQF